MERISSCSVRLWEEITDQSFLYSQGVAKTTLSLLRASTTSPLSSFLYACSCLAWMVVEASMPLDSIAEAQAACLGDGESRLQQDPEHDKIAQRLVRIPTVYERRRRQSR